MRRPACLLRCSRPIATERPRGVSPRSLWKGVTKWATDRANTPPVITRSKSIGAAKTASGANEVATTPTPEHRPLDHRRLLRRARNLIIPSAGMVVPNRNMVDGSGTARCTPRLNREYGSTGAAGVGRERGIDLGDIFVADGCHETTPELRPSMPTAAAGATINPSTITLPTAASTRRIYVPREGSAWRRLLIHPVKLNPAAAVPHSSRVAGSGVGSSVKIAPSKNHRSGNVGLFLNCTVQCPLPWSP